MEAAAGWIEEMGDAGGKGAAAVRAFAALLPPVGIWGEPWPVELDAGALPPFRPGAASYGAALREIAAGRRRLRIDGRWGAGAGTLVLGLVGPGAAATWTVLHVEGLEPD